MTKALFAALAALVCAFTIQLAHGNTDLGSRLSGPWRAQMGGIVEELTLEPLAGNGEGRLSLVRTENGRVTHQISGAWRIKNNPLLDAASRTQLQLGWNDASGRREVSWVIRELTADAMTLVGLYGTPPTVYRRIGR